ncbi:MAG: 16S rRNA (uracil(1498)-N(3))-methyltransferase, partial [Mycobacterium sp.]
MAATLFYAEAIPAAGGTAVVDGEEGFHAATVRRLRIGEEIAL